MKSERLFSHLPHHVIIGVVWGVVVSTFFRKRDSGLWCLHHFCQSRSQVYTLSCYVCTCFPHTLAVPTLCFRVNKSRFTLCVSRSLSGLSHPCRLGWQYRNMSSQHAPELMLHLVSVLRGCPHSDCHFDAGNWSFLQGVRGNVLGRVAGCLIGDIFSLKSFVVFVQTLIDSLVRTTMFSRSSGVCTAPV